jgi:sugar phosphate isomerase/epimerase
MTTTRREFLVALAPLAVLPACVSRESALIGSKPLFQISLAEWSLHKALWASELDHLDFAKKAREDFDIGAIEYVNSFFKERARDAEYLAQMKARCTEYGVESLLIMVDGEGSLGDADDAARTQAVENHQQWIDAAAVLGCHSIRVNAAGKGERDEVAKRAADSLVQIAEYATPHGLNVIVENHGGASSDGSWLAAVMRLADHPRVGTLPDFGNFHLGDGEWYDRYLGVEELMPFAKAVSAKSHEFNEAGDEVRTDYRHMLQIVMDAGYRGWIGIEYEGDQDTEDDGIRRTKALLERVRAEMS